MLRSRRGGVLDRTGARPVQPTLSHLTFLCLNACSGQVGPAVLLALLLALLSSRAFSLPPHLKERSSEEHRRV